MKSGLKILGCVSIIISSVFNFVGADESQTAISAISSSDSSEGVPLKKLVGLLKNFKSQCKAEGVKEGQLFEQYEQWCVQETVKSSEEIAALKQKIENRSAYIMEQQSIQERYRTVVESLWWELSAKEKDLQQLVIDRQK